MWWWGQTAVVMNALLMHCEQLDSAGVSAGEMSADPHPLPDRRSDLYVHLPSNNLCKKLLECFCSLTDVTFSLNIVTLQQQGCMFFFNTWQGSTVEVTCVQRGTKVVCFARQEIIWRIGSLLTNTINPSSFAWSTRANKSTVLLRYVGIVPYLSHQSQV